MFVEKFVFGRGRVKMYGNLQVIFVQLITRWACDVLWRGDSAIKILLRIQAAAATDAADKADAAAGDVEAGMTAPI